MPPEPLVFVPGFPASSLQDGDGRKIYPPSLEDLARDRDGILGLLQGPDDPDEDDGVAARSPIRYSFRIPLLDAGKEAQTLYDLLEDLGYDPTPGSPDFAPVGWDWRRSLDAVVTLDDLEAAIDRFDVPVTVLAHSTGGLVVWALLERRPHLAGSIERIVAIGVPWGGVVKTAPYLTVGRRIGLGSITIFDEEESRLILSRAHGSYDLLPPDPGPGPDGDDLLPPELFTSLGAPVSPLEETSWVPEDDEAAYDHRIAEALGRFGRRRDLFPADVEILNLAGWGVEMPTRCELTNDGPDGEEPPWYEVTKLGDGTVPLASSTWLRGPDVTTFVVPAGVYADQLITQKHSQLWRTPPVKRFLRQRLIRGESRPFFAVAVDDDSAVDTQADVVLRISVAAADGDPLPGAAVTLPAYPGRPELELDGHTLGEMTLSRHGLRPNIGNQLFRFEARLAWEGGEGLVEPLVVFV